MLVGEDTANEQSQRKEERKGGSEQKTVVLGRYDFFSCGGGQPVYGTSAGHGVAAVGSCGKAPS